MKVMTFNLRNSMGLDFKNKWVNRKNIVIDIIEKYNCDIIGVQELTNSMREDIIKTLVGYNFIGEERKSGLFSERNDLLISKRHKIIQCETIWLSKTPYISGSSTTFSTFPRICTSAVIQLNNHIKIRVCNVHLDFLLPIAREREIEILINYLEKKNFEESLPIVLLGDFNSSPSSKVIRKMNDLYIGDKKFTAVQEKNKSIYKHTTMSMFKGNNTGLHLDYIFVTQDFLVKNVEIIKYNKGGRYPSDHYPVFSELEYRNEKTIYNIC